MIRVLDRVLRKGTEREVTSHLRPAKKMCQDSVPSLGNSMCKCLEVDMSVSLQKERGQSGWACGQGLRGEVKVREAGRGQVSRALQQRLKLL